METQNNASEDQDFASRYLATRAKELKYQKQNLPILFAALEGAGVEEAKYEYQGCGDSGHYEAMLFYDTDGKLIESSEITDLEVEVLEFDWCCYPDADPKAVTRPLGEALRDFCYFIIEEAGHSGWENNDGGGGEIAFYVPRGKFDLEHYDNVVERVESSYSSDVLFFRRVI